MQSSARLKNFPVSFFAMVMGMAGLTIAWERARLILDLGIKLDQAVLPVTIGIFLVLTVLYGLKLVRFREAVFKELHHPITINFFPAISISLILISICFLGTFPDISRVLWFAGSALHLFFTLYVMNVWIHHDYFEIHHMNPSWFIPVVGNVLVPVAGVSLGYIETSWFFFSIGLFFWIILMTIIFYRVLFHNPLPEKLMPTFFILIAPPAVAFIAYTKLTGEVDIFARLLYYMGLFLTLLLATQIKRFVRLQFFISWWAYSFPLAAITIATLVMYKSTGLTNFAVLAWVLLSILTIIVVLLLYKTAKAISSKKVCVEH